MTWIKTEMRRKVFLLLAVALLAMSLLLAACGSSATNAGSSNITNNTPQPTPTSQTSSGGADQQVQNAIQSIDGAQNDVNNADATATTENGNDPQP